MKYEYIIIGILGIIGGIACGLADIPLAMSGKAGDKTLYPLGKIAPWWAEVSQMHFSKSFFLSFLGQPFTYLVMWMLAEIMEGQSFGLALALRICTFTAAYTGLFFHAVYCIQPLVYKSISGKTDEDTAAKAVDSVTAFVKIPMIICSISLLLGGTVLVIWAVLSGALPVPKYLALLNPLSGMAITLGLRKAGIIIGGGMGLGTAMNGILLIIAAIILY